VFKGILVDQACQDSIEVSFYYSPWKRCLWFVAVSRLFLDDFWLVRKKRIWGFGRNFEFFGKNNMILVYE
jgi:hypothetical protein